MSTPPFIDLPPGVIVERWPVRGTERAVMHTGLVADRPWALLVPGFTGSKEDFIAVLPLLAETGVGAVSFDQLGQNESDGSVDAGDYALPLLAADIAVIAETAAAQFGLTAPHLLGHSFGGLVVQEAVAAGMIRPASLTLFCTGPGGLPPERWGAVPDLVAALEHADLAEIWRIMHEMEEADETVPPPLDVAAFLERRWHANSPVQLREFALLLMHQPRLVERLRPAIAVIPTTIMWGEDDDAWPIEVQADMAAELGVTSVELPGVGHSPNAQDPQAMVDALLRAWAR
ncbi:MAG: alpha/beta hydrolase [Actinobacteria bacterium]|nr:alpha/beta hydrolase [Actinomycetota bacterium]